MDKRVICLGSVLLLILLSTQAQAQDSCVVTGTIYNTNMTPIPLVKIEVVRVMKDGFVISYGNQRVKSDIAGQVRLVFPRNCTAWLYSKEIPEFNFQGGKGLHIPDASTALLKNLVDVDTMPLFALVAIPKVYFGTTAAGYQAPDTVKFVGASIDFGVFPPTVTISGGGFDTTEITTTLADKHLNFETDIAGKQATLSAAQLARLDSIIAQGLRITFTIEGSIIKIGVDTTGLTSADRITALEIDVGTNTSSIIDTSAYVDIVNALRITIDAKQNALSAAQLARLDSIIAEGTAITISSAGNIKIISVDTVGFNQADRITAIEIDVDANSTAIVDTSAYTDIVNAIRITLDTHIADVSNPHSVDSTQTGAAAGLKSMANGTGWKMQIGAFDGTGVLLGKIPKMGPGGTFIWADDSAGAGGGSIAPYDTTLWTLNDSGYVYLEKGFLSPALAHYGGALYRKGRAVFQMNAATDVASVWEWFVRADSTNGVILEGLHVKSAASRENGRQGDIAQMTEWYTDNNGTGGWSQIPTFWTIPGPAITLYPNFSGLLVTMIYTQKTMSVHYTPYSLSGGLHIELTVFFKVPAANNSTTPIEITGF